MNTKAIAGLAVGFLLMVGGVLAYSSASKSDLPKDTTSKAATNASEQPVALTEVEIKNYAFLPKVIKVTVGQTVTWTNRDSVKHNVVAKNASADAPNGPLIGDGESYKFTFTKAGTYEYYCQPHPSMLGTVIVTE